MTPSTTKTWEGPYERDDLWNDDDPEIIQRDMAKEEPMQPSGRHHDATVPSLVQKQVTGPQRIPFLSPESGDFITGTTPNLQFETFSCSCTPSSGWKEDCYCRSAATPCTFRCGCCNPTTLYALGTYIREVSVPSNMHFPATKAMPECKNIYNNLDGWLHAFQKASLKENLDGIFRPTPCFAREIEGEWGQFPDIQDGQMELRLFCQMIKAPGPENAAPARARPYMGAEDMFPILPLSAIFNSSRALKSAYTLYLTHKIPDAVLVAGLEYKLDDSEYWYSFCLKKWVNGKTVTHCWDCGECRSTKDWHCGFCNRCAEDGHVCEFCRGVKEEGGVLMDGMVKTGNGNRV